MLGEFIPLCDWQVTAEIFKSITSLVFSIRWLNKACLWWHPPFSPHSKKVHGSNLAAGLSVWSLHIILVPVCVFHRHSGFLPHSKDLLVRSKMAVDVSMIGLSVCVCPVMAWHTRVYPAFCLLIAGIRSSHLHDPEQDKQIQRHKLIDPFPGPLCSFSRHYILSREGKGRVRTSPGGPDVLRLYWKQSMDWCVVTTLDILFV